MLMKYIGIDLGGTNIVAGLMDKDGKIIKKYTRDTIPTRSIEEIFDDIIDMCDIIIKEYSLDKSSLKCVGIGVPGEVDVKKGVINYSNNISIKDFNARIYMKKLCEKVGFDIEFFFANDADCAALGEFVAGTGKHSENLIILTLGTGVGGGIIIDNKIFSGFYPGGAELGHQTIVHDGRECTCGNKGCLEAYASATALINMAKEEAKKDSSSMLNTVSDNIEKLTAKDVFDTADKGDKLASRLIDDYAEYLATGIANLINIFKPEMVLLAGGISKRGDKLVKEVEGRIKGKAFGPNMITKIKIATLGNDAGLIGAGMLGRDTK